MMITKYVRWIFNYFYKYITGQELISWVWTAANKLKNMFQQHYQYYINIYNKCMQLYMQLLLNIFN